MRSVGMLDLKAEYALFRDQARAVVDQVLDDARFIGGPQVGQLEERVASLCERKFAVAVSSGTDALLCAMMCLGVEPGDEVITTPFTFFATVGTIHRLGARPVFVDVEPDTFNIDPAKIEAAVTDRTKLILPVHLFGQPAEMDAIKEIAAGHERVRVLADAAQAIGATYRARPACAAGCATTLSFYPTKNLGGFGEGGMILTDDEALAHRCRMARNHGETSRYHHEFVGGNFRLDTIKAAILLIKLDHLARFLEARQRNAARYDELLADVPVTTPVVRPHSVSAWHQYSILCDDRDALMAHLKERGVGSGIYYPVPLHLQACFAYLH
ncbi:MAG TPA: DegT/DnrJ/EryC1/StrS family aminotransferase, partial [Phycisphaerae bacterium]|nr:DegT/DnrJ/EryC1/StrS family aminotransferase [Phycisphaerae bacterium]